ncbi:uncharacterized protein LOC107043397 [Diachasma alloeum]|uniref:uncharacterized protein LOC107043397 n=1 Tax=Diachasma alloeum TaxID=454923 RepID=UPI0007381B21|nr:uncharacterized protein LOC107043397 [Diachasma alloeum]
MKYYEIQRCNSEKQQLLEMRRILNAAELARQRLQCDNPLKIATIPVLLAYFKENQDRLYIIRDAATTEDDLEACISAPTPTLVILGNSLYDRSASCKIYIESKPCLTADNVLQGFLITFLAYFVFGLEYPSQIKSTLEFIQRIFLDINPELGHKRVSGQKRRRSQIDVKSQSLSEYIEKFHERLANFNNTV